MFVVFVGTVKVVALIAGFVVIVGAVKVEVDPVFIVIEKFTGAGIYGASVPVGRLWFMVKLFVPPIGVLAQSVGIIVLVLVN
jgi:hypothetical protein